MARTRRVGNRRSQAARGRESSAANEESAVEEIDFDDIEEVDDDDLEDSGVSRGRSSRRSRAASSVTSRSGRRSRRSSVRSGRKSDRRSGARGGLSDEDREARRAGRKAMLHLIIGLFVLAGAGYGIFWMLQTNPLKAEADGTLNASRQHLEQMENALNNLKPEQAAEHYVQGTELIKVPMFANAAGDINLDDPKLASLEHAKKARKLLNKFEDQYVKIDRVRKRVLAQTNLTMIMNMLNNLGSLETDEELDRLEQLIKGYRQNPLDPELGDASPVAQEEYSTLIARLTGKDQDVVQERKHRIEARTTAIQSKVNSTVSNLLGQERYQAALDHIDEQAEKWPEAELGAERDRVIESARQRWQVSRQNAESKYADGTSSTNSTKKREESLKDAVSGMDNVIDKYGIEEYVREARELKRKYEQALRNLKG